MRELLEQTGRRFEERARSSGRAIAVDAPEGLSASLDPVRMRQALGNLVDNGLRHGSGAISLSARAVDRSLQNHGKRRGHRLPGWLAAHAFERFTRGDAARTRGGAGLGLAIVKAIAEAHGGSASIDGRAAVRVIVPVYD